MRGVQLRAPGTTPTTEALPANRPIPPHLWGSSQEHAEAQRAVVILNRLAREDGFTSRSAPKVRRATTSVLSTRFATWRSCTTDTRTTSTHGSESSRRPRRRRSRRRVARPSTWRTTPRCFWRRSRPSNQLGPHVRQRPVDAAVDGELPLLEFRPRAGTSASADSAVGSRAVPRAPTVQSTLVSHIRALQTR